MTIRGGMGMAFVCSALAASSCGSQLDVESDAAGARVADLRARFPLGPDVVTRFEAAPGPGAATHMQAVLPDGVLRGVTRPARVALPIHATDEVRIEDARSGLSVRFVLDNMHDARVELVRGVALYPRALGGADVVHRVHAEGTEDFVFFESRPAEEKLTYSLDLSRIAGLRLVSNTLEFLDDAGTPVLRVAPPYVVDATSRRHEARLAVSGCAYDANPVGPWGRRVTSPGASRCRVHVTWGGDVVYPAMVDPAWSSTGSMATARTAHAAAVLPSGRVLIVGGTNQVGYLETAELYDPTGAGSFAATGPMSTKRVAHTASVLSSGRVLVAGGFDPTGAHRSAEIYDPAGTGTFVATGNMSSKRRSHAATALPSGEVLLTGGENIGLEGGVNPFLKSADLFDPAGDAGAGVFKATGDMLAVRENHSATLLPSGKVLIAGGVGAQFPMSPVLSKAELFDPAATGGAGGFAATGSMTTGRYLHTATLLATGKVLMAGGSGLLPNGGGGPVASTELYNPVDETFTPSGAMSNVRGAARASLLASGKVLFAGGSSGGTELASAELFDPAANAGAGGFTLTASLATARDQHSASVLASGKVLVVGGWAGPARVALASAEVFGGTLGEACSVDGYCSSGLCADGVCCDSACAGGCDRCDIAGKEGTCSVVPAGNAGASPTCGSPYVCDGTKPACPTSCASDVSCTPAYYCATDGTCQPRKEQASACDTQKDCKQAGCRECATGVCADGVCCNKACGRCEACARSLNGLADGTCSPAKDGLDPHGVCEPAAAVCGADGMCDGSGACRVVTPAGVPCASDGSICDGAGRCALQDGGGADAGSTDGASCDGDHSTRAPDGEPVDCRPYKCSSDGSCRAQCSSVADCVAPAVCSDEGKCAVPRDHADDTGSRGCAVSENRGEFPGSVLVWLAVTIGALRVRRARSERAESIAREDGYSA